jgi:hypothetical protein
MEALATTQGYTKKISTPIHVTCQACHNSVADYPHESQICGVLRFIYHLIPFNKEYNIVELGKWRALFRVFNISTRCSTVSMSLTRNSQDQENLISAEPGRSTINKFYFKFNNSFSFTLIQQCSALSPHIPSNREEREGKRRALGGGERREERKG